MSSYRDLKVWKDSFELTKLVYKATVKLPSNEKFGLASQIQRCAVSIPSNIAEGQQRKGANEFKQFLGIARGSAAELSTQLLLAQDIYSIELEILVEKTEEIQKMLYSLQQKL
ncbi:MAG: four helix bundle protein [Candidatus Saccharibacteria bacterium]|nr:four helix bundle protein [Candidatus Saccharibacteria bacterium]